MKYFTITIALFITGLVHGLPTTIITTTTTNALQFPILKNEQVPFSPSSSSIVTSNMKEDKYIVMLKEHLNNDNLQQHALWVSNLAQVSQPTFINWLNPNDDHFGIQHFFNSPGLKGYSGKFDDQMLKAIRLSDDVAYIEKDGNVYINELQRNAPWGIARISRREKTTYKNFNKYNYDETTAGEGVKVYVVDTGINLKHVEFEGRAKWGQTFISPDDDEKENIEDDNHGHGTHVGATIGGKKFGVAKKTQLIALKPINSEGHGPVSAVIKSIDWIINAHLSDVQKQKQQNQNTTHHNHSFKGSVINLSLGYEYFKPLNRAVNAAVEAGIHVAIAAGNENESACLSSPASAELPITVGATGINDERAFFSNYGECVDVFAPGYKIESAWIGSDHATLIGSGTSMATPHVAGLAAYLLSQTENGMSPKELKEKIITLSTKNALTNVGKGSPNSLIYNGYDHV